MAGRRWSDDVKEPFKVLRLTLTPGVAVVENFGIVVEVGRTGATVVVSLGKREGWVVEMSTVSVSRTSEAMKRRFYPFHQRNI